MSIPRASSYLLGIFSRDLPIWNRNLVISASVKINFSNPQDQPILSTSVEKLNRPAWTAGEKKTIRKCLKRGRGQTAKHVLFGWQNHRNLHSISHAHQTPSLDRCRWQDQSTILEPLHSIHRTPSRVMSWATQEDQIASSANFIEWHLTWTRCHWIVTRCPCHPPHCQSTVYRYRNTTIRWHRHQLHCQRAVAHPVFLNCRCPTAHTSNLSRPPAFSNPNTTSTDRRCWLRRRVPTWPDTTDLKVLIKITRPIGL